VGRRTFLFIDTIKQISCAQRAASILAEMLGCNWKIAKSVSSSDTFAGAGSTGSPPSTRCGRSDSYAVVMGGICLNPSAKEYRYFYHPWTSNRAATLDMCAKEFLGAATLIMLCARDTARQAHTAFRVQDRDRLRGHVQCWEWRSAGRSEGVAHALWAVDDATTLFDISTYTYLEHIPGVQNPLAGAVSRAQRDMVFHPTRPYRCVRVEINLSWQTRWL
jgi:hypothetical protein